MIKKSVSLFLSAILIVTMICNAYAVDTKLRMVDVNLPDITAELTGDVKKGDISTVKLNGEKLEIEQVSKQSDLTQLVYVLVDISGSMSQSAFNALKPSLIKFAKNLDKKTDKFVLMTFGEKVTTLLKGGESDAKIESVINSIVCNSNNTTFYKALNDVYKSSEKETGYERKYAIVISDGADLDNGNSSEQEVVDNYKTHRLPLYALCDANTTKSSMDGFGYISRVSGGELYGYSYYNATESFDSVKSVIDDVTLVKLKSKKKKSQGTKFIEFELGDELVKQEVLVKAKADNKAPTVEEVSYNKDTNSFVLKFSESVDNAGDIASYKIKKGDKEITIVSVEYKNGKSTVYMQDTVYSGEYTFELSGITDATDNANSLAENELVRDIEATPVVFKVLKIVGIASIPILFLLAIFLILLFLKKKKNVKKIKDIFITQTEEEEVESIHVTERKSMPIKLYIDSDDGNFYTVSYNLVTSVIVGRSEIADLKIEDAMMSRQHFAIEKNENVLAVVDLDSVNGTFINGVKIGSRTFLNSGDRITAGNSVIRVIYGERG